MSKKKNTVEIKDTLNDSFNRSPRDKLYLFVLTWLFFLINLKYPITRNFDEFHYIPSAYQWFDLIPNQNWEHPPLAKQLMTLGLFIFGDDPIGWRFSSTLFGALTLLGIYGVSEELFKNRKAALICTFLSFINQLIFVQSRIAMLDTFMVAFLFLSFWFLLKAVYGQTKWKSKPFIFSGILMGFAISSKWFSMIPYFIALFLLAFLLFKPNPLKTKTNQNALFKKNSILFLSGWGLIPLLFYLLPFFLYLAVNRTPPFTLKEILWDMHWTMLNGQKSVGGHHPYSSPWWSWPLMLRPIWYAYDAEGLNKEWIRGVLLLGNPAIMWGGILSIFYSFYAVFLKKNISNPMKNIHLLFLILYFGCLFSWALIPRQLTFYYYYYPNGILLSFFLTLFFTQNTFSETIKNRILYIFISLSFLLFIFYFPILSALKIPSDQIRTIIWFNQWI